MKKKLKKTNQPEKSQPNVEIDESSCQMKVEWKNKQTTKETLSNEMIKVVEVTMYTFWKIFTNTSK